MNYYNIPLTAHDTKQYQYNDPEAIAKKKTPQGNEIKSYCV